MKLIKTIIVSIILVILAACDSSGGSDVANSLPINPEVPNIIDGDPVILFSDMESAPAKGWSLDEPKKGASITIWGRNFGNSRNDSYVTIAGVKLTDNKDYAVWGENWPTPFWQKITFFLNDKMLNGKTNIRVTIAGRTSNLLPFTIRDGRIFFVKNSGEMGDGSINSPFVHGKLLNKKIAEIQPGDIWYYRSGIYTEGAGESGQSVLATHRLGPHGTKENPISFIAYPGEKPILSLQTYNPYFQGSLSLNSDYYTFSGFKLDSVCQGANLSNFSRFVGNDVIALKGKFGSGNGAINTFKSGAKIFGNAIHGGRSKSRFDHAVYFSGAPIKEGSYLGWNYIYDNDYGRGPEIAINHQDDRVPTDQYVKSHYLFNNIVDANPQRASIISFASLSWTEGEANQPEPIYIYNNIFLNGGTLDLTEQYNIGWAPALTINDGAHSRIYNNVFYNTAYNGIRIYETLSSDIQNNIFVMNSDIPVSRDEHYYVISSATKNINLSNNLFYDMGNGDMRIGNIDTTKNIIGKDPKFINPDNFNFKLASGSPAKGLGNNDLNRGNRFPDFAPLDRDFHYLLRSNNRDLGVH